jgi:hypothetical protein
MLIFPIQTMRTLPALLILLLISAVPVLGQRAVRPSDLDGTWQLSFDVDLSDADGPFERIALKAVMGLLDEVDVRFAFRADHELRVMVDALGDKDEETSKWWITDGGALVLGDTGPVDSGDDAIWMKGDDDDVLWAYESLENGKPGDRKGMYLTRMGG